MGSETASARCARRSAFLEDGVVMTRCPNLRRLRRLVLEAREATRQPPEPGMTTWPLTFPIQHLTPEAWAILWDLVRVVRERHARVYASFLREHAIIELVVDYFADRDGLARLN